MIRLLLFIISLCALHADIEDHLKPVGDKSGVHQMKNIDFIYLINLDKRPEKLKLCIHQLLPYGIYPHRFSAVNGWELPLEVINDVGLKYESWMPGGQWGTCFLLENGGKPYDEPIEIPGRTYFHRTVAPGAIGCVLSHLSVLQDAIDSGYETIWIMEDDIEIVRDPHLLSALIDQLDSLVGKKGWDILFTDPDTKSQQGDYVPCISYVPRPNFNPSNPGKFAERHNISTDLRRVGARFGSYSMIIRRSGMKKILNFIKLHQVFLPYDMEYTLPPNIRLYTVREDIVSTQPQAPTDNGSPNYRNPLLN